MKHVDANGIRFAYLERGEGPLVICCHGFPDTAHTWDDLLPRLADRGYRAVAPFMRGYHPTEVPAKDTDSETLGRDVLALIDALGGGEPAILIGHDWGAVAVYAATAMRPERVAKLFALAIPNPAAVRITPQMLWALRHFFFYKLPGAPKRFAKDDFAALRRIYRRWSPTWSPPPEEFEAILECFGHEASLDAAFGYYRALSGDVGFMKTPIPVDTVVFAGREDPAVTPAAFYGAKRMFTGSYVVEEMPGGHFLHREHPEEFAERLFAHLGTPASTRGA